jgi:DNA-binding Lrp family transcriptional regulator
VCGRNPDTLMLTLVPSARSLAGSTVTVGPDGWADAGAGGVVASPAALTVNAAATPRNRPVARIGPPFPANVARRLVRGAASGWGCAAHYDASPARRHQGGSMAVSAYILIQTEVGKAAQVADEVSGIDGVVSAEDVTGPYDVIARAESNTVDELGKMVVSRVQMIEGITRTLTCPVVHL